MIDIRAKRDNRNNFLSRNPGASLNLPEDTTKVNPPIFNVIKTKPIASEILRDGGKRQKAIDE